MTDWSTAQYTGPAAEECEQRRRRALEGQARRAERQQRRIAAYIDHTGPDPDDDTAISGPEASPPAEAPKAALLAKVAAAKDKLAKLKRRPK